MDAIFRCGDCGNGFRANLADEGGTSPTLEQAAQAGWIPHPEAGKGMLCPDCRSKREKLS
jgi:DNA-directed RNA polymerase subunit RPC12/RpoP